MKTKILLTTVSAFFILHSAFAQGALTPPGPPAPTMKTLNQIEPRLPISSAPFIIFTSGSYYLTTNLTVSTGGAIAITVSGVTFDLNGFTISSTTPNAVSGGSAIQISSGLSDITIANGHIRSGVTNNGSGVFSGSGFSAGVSYIGSTAPVNVLVSKVSVSGCLTNGIELGRGDATVVEACTARTIGGDGITASTIKSCVATDCGNYAIYGDQVSDCRGSSVGNAGIGIYADTALNCYGFGTGSGTGISAVNAQNCHGWDSGNGYGVYVYGTASGCFGYSGIGTGLYAFIGSVCRGTTAGGTPFNITHNVNSF